MPPLNIVVSCTKRKTVPPLPHCRFGAVNGSTLRQVARKWIRQLRTANAETIPASELYAGDHWQIARSIIEVGRERGLRVKLWVCSAGYGLIRADAPIHPYSATFSRPHPDSVFAAMKLLGKSIGDWWAELSDWEGPQPGTVRNLADLARNESRTPLMIVASPVYCDAVFDDLLRAQSLLRDPERLVVISGGGRLRGGLAEHQLPCDARLQRAFGGALMSLNIRTAAFAVSQYPKWPLTLSELKHEMGKIIQTLPPPPTYHRKPMTDDQIRTFIGRRLRRDPSACHTGLLRMLRQEMNAACEQKRFRALYREVSGEQHG